MIRFGVINQPSSLKEAVAASAQAASAQARSIAVAALCRSVQDLFSGLCKPSLSCPGCTSPCFPQAVTVMLLCPEPCLCKHQCPDYGGFPWRMVSTNARTTPSFPLFLLLDYSFSLQYRKNTVWDDEWNRSPFPLFFPFLAIVCCCSSCPDQAAPLPHT